MKHQLANHIDWKTGILADCVRASLRARTQEFIRDAESEAVQIFGKEERRQSMAGDWYGEHAGKWLVAASHAYRRTKDLALLAAIRSVLDYLQSAQESNGYLGTYAQEAPCRFDHEDADKVRTWDLWVHAWMMLGVLAASDIPELAHHRPAAEKIADMIEASFGGARSIVDQGNHSGLSSAVVVEPLARLGRGELIRAVLDDLENRGIPVLSGGVDVAQLGTGKIYQLLWLFLGMSISGHDESVLQWWDQIQHSHLNPLGGPWGGIGGHKEVFNAAGFFDPCGMVETCSSATWMALNQQLFLQTGEERFAVEFERSLLNSLVGALDSNGRDWCYFTFANGRRNNTYHWACCKSSGALALEQAVDMAVTRTDSGVSVNLFVPCLATFDQVQVEQCWLWDGLDLSGLITIRCDGPTEVRMRHPQWADSVSLGSDQEFSAAAGWLTIPLAGPGEWKIPVRFKCSIRVSPFRYTIDHHGQEIVSKDYAFVSVGPLVYACGKFDGFREDETLRLAQLTPAANFHFDGMGDFGPRLSLKLPGRPSIEFLPYAEAGGRHDHAWRRTWLQVAWQ